MATDGQRRERHYKLQHGFLVQEFLPMLEDELRRFGSDRNLLLSFHFVPDKWTVITSTSTTYDEGGYYTDDDSETITKVRVHGRIVVNGEPRGTVQPIDYGPQQGFAGIDAAVETALAAVPDSEKPNPEHRAGMLRMDRIVGTSYTFDQPGSKDKDDEPKDERIIELIGLMKSMKISRKQAVQCAEAAVKAHPDCHDSDDLFKIAMEIYEREYMGAPT